MSSVPAHESPAQAQPPGKSSSIVIKIRKFFKLSWANKLNILQDMYYLLKGMLYYRWIFGSFGKGSIVYPPALLNNPQRIHIGKNVLIRKGARLETVMLDPSNPPSIHIEDNIRIEQDAHIVSLGKMVLHTECGVGPRCTLLAAAHPFFDVSDPVKVPNRVGGVGSVLEIGSGAILSANSVVLMNVRIGKHVVVGANSVVKRSVPDYCVVEGNPAVIVLQYDAAEDRWLPPAKKMK